MTSTNEAGEFDAQCTAVLISGEKCREPEGHNPEHSPVVR